MSAAPEAALDAPARSVWAYVRRPTSARAAPARGAPVVAPLPAETQFASREVVLVLDGAGRWLHVRLPVANGATGWVPRSALDELRETRRAVVVDTAALRASLLRDGEELWSAPVAIGDAGWPTPRGEFWVRARLVPSARTPLYGPFAFVTSGIVPREPWPGAQLCLAPRDEPAGADPRPRVGGLHPDDERGRARAAAAASGRRARHDR